MRGVTFQWEGSRCSERGHVAVGGVTLLWEGSRCSGRGHVAVGGVTLLWGVCCDVMSCRRVPKR